MNVDNEARVRGWIEIMKTLIDARAGNRPNNVLMLRLVGMELGCLHFGIVTPLAIDGFFALRDVTTHDDDRPQYKQPMYFWAGDLLAVAIAEDDMQLDHDRPAPPQRSGALTEDELRELIGGGPTS